MISESFEGSREVELAIEFTVASWKAYPFSLDMVNEVKGEVSGEYAWDYPEIL